METTLTSPLGNVFCAPGYCCEVVVVDPAISRERVLLSVVSGCNQDRILLTGRKRSDCSRRSGPKPETTLRAIAQPYKDLGLVQAVAVDYLHRVRKHRVGLNMITHSRALQLAVCPRSRSCLFP
jgi:hypothetical protein